MSQRNAVAVLLGLFASTGGSVFAQETELTNSADVPGANEDPTEVSVVEEGADPSDVAETSDELSDEEQLRLAFLRYRELLADGVTDEADSVAKQVIELSIRLNGATSIDTARALSNLAIVQQMNEQYGAAQQNFQSAIDIIEDREDRLNTLLINPLKGLGKAQLAAERPDLAARTFKRAVHITHVNEGPHNMDQIELLESLAETNLRLGLTEDAKRVHDTVYALNVRYYRSEPLALVPSLMRRANWQHRTGHINDERATYRRVIRIIETSSNKQDVRLIPPLTNLGRSFFFPDLTNDASFSSPAPSAGEIYLKRAARIARESQDSSWRLLSDTLLSLGDYYLFLRQLPRAKINYREVWELLSDDEDKLRRRDTLFKKPVLLQSNPLPRFAGSASQDDMTNEEEPLQSGILRYEFTVSDRGRVTNLKVRAQEPREFTDMQRYLVREMRSRIYRPMFEAGRAVEAENLTGTHRFLYKQADLDALRIDMDEPSDDESETSEPEQPST